MNGLKTAMLLGLLSALLMVGGRMIAGQQGMMIGLTMAVVMNFASYFFSEKIALSMYRAQPLTPEENSHIYARIAPMVHRLTEKMGIPMPKLWVIPGATPNAFATGRNPDHASVAVTEGLLSMMDERELEGVIAHELGHIKHRDILISSIAATMAAALSQIAYMGMWFGGRRDDDEDSNPYAAILMIVIAPIAAALIQMAISRQREYAADAAAARYTGSPDGLINALRKLERGNQRFPMDASPATAHMFIFPPVLGGMARLFSTHPSMEARIANLESVRGQVA